MLKVFTSNTGNNACRLVMTELKNNNVEDSNHIVIVPDRFAMSVEKEIFDYLGLDGAFNIDVVSFTRLAIKNLKSKDKQCLTKEGGIVMLTAILLDEVNNLKFYKRLVGKRELAKDLYAVIASLRASRVTPDVIRETFKDKPQNLKDKYDDIAHLIEVYEDRLNTIKGDSLTRLNRFEDGIVDNQNIKDSDIYIIGFDTFKANEYDIIEKLVKTAKSVNVGLNIGVNGAKNTHLFSIKEVKKLIRICGGEVVNQEKQLDKGIEEVYKNIFSLSGTSGKKTNKIELVEEANTHEEIKGVALEIASLIREGYRYLDIAVVTHDDSTRGIIEDIFTRLSIPIYVDKKYLLKETLIARLVDSAINVLTSGYERDKLLSFAKNPILGIPYGDIENLEDYILRRNLNHQRLLMCIENEDDLGLEETRKKIVNSLLRFENAIKVAEGIQELKSLYKDVDDSLYTNLYGETGVCPDKVLESINNRAKDLLDAELDEFSMLVGEKIVSLEDFYTMIKGGIDSVEISLIPNIIDAVFVGTNSDSRFFDKKIIFVMGTIDGVMPVAPSYHAVMPERDINIFDRQDVHIYPTPLESIRKDKGALAELLTCATDKVYVSYAKFSLSNTPQTAGDLFKQVKYILSGNPVVSLSKKYSLLNAESLGSINNAFYEYLKRSAMGQDENSKVFLGELKTFLEEEGYSQRLKTNIEEDAVITPIDLYLSKKDNALFVYPTQIESFYACPFKHFMRFGLKLKEKQKGDADVKIVGIFLHEVLEQFFKETKSRLKNMSDNDVKSTATEVAEEVAGREEYRHLYNDEKNAKLLSDIKKESVENILRMMPQIKAGDFVPTYFEYRFMDDGLDVTMYEKIIKLKGTIDRVDFCGDEFFVVDYKSGSVAGKDDTSKLFYGTNIQLYLYLLPFIKKGKRPVGAFYLSISSGYETKQEKVSRFVGKITLDESTLRRLDNGLTVEGNTVQTTALPSALKMGKNGFDANQNAGFRQPDFEFAATYAEEAVKRALTAMSKGYIKKHPLKKGSSGNEECEYCEYAPLCDNKKVRNIYARKINNGRFKKDENNG